MRTSQLAAVDCPQPMTYEEFLDWCDEDTLAEWVDGYVLMTSPASEPHQALVDFFIQVLGIYVQQRDLGRIISAPFQMKLVPARSGREPDILFIAQEHVHRLKHTYLDGPADLAIEVVSPESRLRDRGEKFAEYEVSGIPEYWIFDPDEQRSDYYLLASDGRYERKRPDNQGIYRSAVVPGFWLKEEWLWRDPLPKALAVLHELGIL